MAVKRGPRHKCSDCEHEHRPQRVEHGIMNRWVHCLRCGEKFSGDYSVHNRVWKAAGLKAYDGTCHLSCLEELLGRKLTADDLAPYPVNDAIRHFLKRAG